LLTQHTVTIRNFGRLQNIVVPSSAAYFANGNNLTVVGDLTRRSLIGRIDPQVERPELSEFPFHPVKLAIRARPLLVRCVLTIVLARLCSGYRSGVSPLGSYDEWSYLVRDSLLWLDEPDPIGVMERAREFDPRLSRLRAIMAAWWEIFGTDALRTRDVVEAANATFAPGEHGDDAAFKNPDLRDAIYPIAANQGIVSPDKLGWWIKRNLDRTVVIDGVGSLRFSKAEETTHGARWRLMDTSVKDDELPF
jgi:putative DNA primase/helicase